MHRGFVRAIVPAALEGVDVVARAEHVIRGISKCDKCITCSCSPIESSLPPSWHAHATAGQVKDASPPAVIVAAAASLSRLVQDSTVSCTDITGPDGTG